MKLLFDQNLSPRLVNRLADLYLSEYVYLINSDQADDRTVWEHSRKNGLTIVTRDSDFSELSVLRGFPPKVIWIRRDNCSTHQIEQLLRLHNIDMLKFGDDANLGLLTLH
ncbi:MAG: DUF5615 family PIN-like protein [Microcoleaceae cyanobacterium]